MRNYAEESVGENNWTPEVRKPSRESRRRRTPTRNKVSDCSIVANAVESESTEWSQENKLKEKPDIESIIEDLQESLSVDEGIIDEVKGVFSRIDRKKLEGLDKAEVEDRVEKIVSLYQLKENTNPIEDEEKIEKFKEELGKTVTLDGDSIRH